MHAAHSSGIPGGSVSRFALVSNLVLAALIVVQSWTLHAVLTEAHKPSVASIVDADSKRIVDPQAFDRVASRLDRIDARLATLDAIGVHPGTTGADAGSATPRIAMSGAEADFRLQAMLPGREITRRQLLAFPSRLAALPPAEQHALSAALARALNEERVRLSP